MHDGLGRLYQKRMKQAFDKKVRPREFKERDLVLKKTLSYQPDSKGMWMPNYEDPCAVTPVTTNVGAVKKYFVKIINQIKKSTRKKTR